MSVPNATENSPVRLIRSLGLYDVYAISTGAMFSSGFFLLPGLAAAATGPSVPLAYLAAGFLIVPAMLSVAELATAMPRAGGAYYFLDRSMGPLVGTVGGLGTWLALILKTAFALVGMGAYLSLYVDVAVEPLALLLTVLFMMVNVGGAKETSGLQRVLVTVLLFVMVGFMVSGWLALIGGAGGTPLRERFTPLFAFGATGFASTIGLVFVSYAGLTKVASVAEEIRDPDRNIPLGMALSLLTAMVVYTVGVFIIVAVLPADVLQSDLTPVATAAAAFPAGPAPPGVGVLLIVVAATAAFASTGNAGILAASRYPLAMGRDGLVSPRFGVLGRFRTPTFSIVVTATLVGACITLFDVSSIAKLASAFQLLLFALLCLAVVIMRESGIAAYDPGYRSPLYPWMQIFGVLTPLWLIAEMGQLALFFTFTMIALTVMWYFYYAKAHIRRGGAILHTLARIGELRYEGLDRELGDIVRRKGLRKEDPFDEVVARAVVIDVEARTTFQELAATAAARLTERVGVPAATLEVGFLADVKSGLTPVSHGVALPHYRVPGLEIPAMVIVRSVEDLDTSALELPEGYRDRLAEAHAIFFVLSGTDEPTLHLRILGHLAELAEGVGFIDRWMAATDDAGLKRALLEDDRLMTIEVGAAEGTSDWTDLRLRELELPMGSLIALILRDGQSVVPSGSTIVRRGDRLTVIGDPDAIQALGTAEGRRAVPKLAGQRIAPDA